MRGVDSHRVHCTAISKQLKFYGRLVTLMDPYTLHRRSLLVPLRLGEVLRHKHWSDAIHPFTLEMQKCSQDGCVISNMVCHHLDQSEQQSGLSLEWIRWSNFLCKVYQFHCCAGLCRAWRSLEIGGRAV